LEPDTTGTRQLARYAWETLVSLVALVVGFAIPLRLVLSPDAQPLSPTVDGVVSVLFALDLILWLRARGLPLGRRLGAWGWLAVDLLAALPFGRILNLPAASLFRLLKLLGVASTIRAWRRRMVIHPTVMRLASFILWAGFLAHLLACGWITLGGPTPFLGTDSRYLSALYWCVTTLTTVGYGDVTPVTTVQTISTMVVMLLGVGVYGFVIGNVANLLSKVDMARSQYVATVERLTGFLRYRRVPTALQREIHAYYKYVWENRLGYDEASVLEDLPPTLRAELSMVLKRDLIEKVEFLRGASADLIQDLSVKLRPVVFTPGDVILRAGDVGRHIYFISRGTVEVIAPDGKTVLRTLSDGDFFGEAALLHTERRTASVRAVGYCDLYVLDKETFSGTLELYPEFAESIRRVSAAWTQPAETEEDASPPPSVED
jgi:voltage-gated potassium channel